MSISVQSAKSGICSVCTPPQANQSALVINLEGFAEEENVHSTPCAECAHKLWIALGVVLGGVLGCTPQQLLKRKTKS